MKEGDLKNWIFFINVYWSKAVILYFSKLIKNFSLFHHGKPLWVSVNLICINVTILACQHLGIRGCITPLRRRLRSPRPHKPITSQKSLRTGSEEMANGFHEGPPTSVEEEPSLRFEGFWWPWCLFLTLFRSTFLNFPWEWVIVRTQNRALPLMLTLMVKLTEN